MLTRVMFYLIFVSLIYCPPAASFGKYPHKGEIPEPLIFDLVRRIDSDEGEFEVNTLMVHGDKPGMKSLEIAPEIEWAFVSGKAIELELPTVDGKIKTIKVAYQMQLPNWIGDLTGFQLMQESFTKQSTHETTPLLLIAKRLSRRWSTLTMLGNRFIYGNAPEIKKHKMRELPIMNFNLFYDSGPAFDLGLEINNRGIGASFEELIIMPQLHALLMKDFKIQGGFGTSYDGYRFSPLSAFRFIKEYN